MENHFFAESNNFYSNSISSEVTESDDNLDIRHTSTSNTLLTVEDVTSIVRNMLSSIKIYVVESDITSAQNSVRAIVEQATF